MKPLNKVTLEVNKKIKEIAAGLPKMQRCSVIGVPMLQRKTNFITGADLDEETKKNITEDLDKYQDEVVKINNKNPKSKLKLITDQEKEKIFAWNENIIYPQTVIGAALINHEVNLRTSYQRKGEQGILEYLENVKISLKFREEQRKEYDKINKKTKSTKTKKNGKTN